MPYVTVKMLGGRTDEQKKRLVEAITNDMVEICNAKAEAVVITIEELPKEHWAVGGVRLSDME